MNIIIVIAPLETGVDALTRCNEDGTYTIIVNNRLSEEKARKAIMHEVFHVKKDDFSSFEKASLLERMLRESDYLNQELENINFYYHVV
ncbi:ImmA/IrrE family metallo-endopeptidase [Veillonella sp. KGMB01456]|uniref:ImmA/IrrE family metallo-endopeptidase n=1 Tax=Veillonella sp. KGMB01456 TaxID=2934794 RepID=UPI001FF6C163|nr:ImmA/IrrE family metallo-endopeptidase [Veillonella sp. KGMB01456]MCK0529842.1 ImmA/IrrE family metallo-endopeptidase [Veillonella sp. KGMB01456]